MSASLNTFDRRTRLMIRHLLDFIPIDTVSPEFNDDLINLINGFDFTIVSQLNPTQKERITSMFSEIKNTKVTNARALDILRNLRRIIIPLSNHSLITMGVNDSGIEGRLTRMEKALANAKSNPMLEKKLAQIEEELKKVVVTSEQVEEKEQEDLIKRYKTAKKKAFAIMPFNPAFDDIWIGGIDRACTTSSYCCIRVDKISTSTWINDDIEKCIDLADVVIADITGNNANVMFELGWALAKDKKPIIIRQKDDNLPVPFDVQNYRHIKYVNSWSGVEDLCKQITKYIKSSAEVSEKSKD
jgi:hypothetical protein